MATIESVDGIRDWFDETYRARGRRYLRPPRAYRVLLDLLKVRPGGKLLDVACGPGHLLSEARGSGLELFGVDFSSVALDMGRRLAPEARFFEADAAELPFPDASFDYITCIGALERMPERERVLAEQRRVAKPDARFCFLVRGADTFTWRLVMERLGYRNTRGHQDAASLRVWTERFEHAGFHIEAVLPDQWPLMWAERLLHRVGVETSFTRMRSGFVPLRFANEFIFVTTRGSSSS